MLILVTGKSGAGKSTILKGLKFKNIIYMDDVVKNEFYKKGHPLFDEVIKTFGNVETNGRIDTSKLGPLVFNDAQKLDKLNKLVKPHVVSYLKSLKGKWVVEMAAYIDLEKEYKDLFDIKILVESSYDRIDDKFNYLKDKKQPISNKTIKYDFLINNDGPLDTSILLLETIIDEFN